VRSRIRRTRRRHCRRSSRPIFASAVNAPVLPAANWAKQTGNGRFFKVIVVGAGVDPLLTDLRNAVAAAGGAVNYRYQSIKGFSATIPAPALNLLAQRADVDSISPNRPATKTASLLELATGADAARSLAGLAPGTTARAWASRSSIPGSTPSTPRSSPPTARPAAWRRWSI
jgi:hypothetical protein